MPTPPSPPPALAPAPPRPADKQPGLPPDRRAGLLLTLLVVNNMFTGLLLSGGKWDATAWDSYDEWRAWFNAAILVLALELALVWAYYESKAPPATLVLQESLNVDQKN